MKKNMTHIVKCQPCATAFFVMNSYGRLQTPMVVAGNDIQNFCYGTRPGGGVAKKRAVSPRSDHRQDAEELLHSFDHVKRKIF